jgi:hypothetical protein
MDRKIMNAIPVAARDFVPLPVDSNLQVALSLARASTAALLSLSALANREMIAALTEEAARLHTFGDGMSMDAAEVLERYLPSRVEPQAGEVISLRPASRYKFKV